MAGEAVVTRNGAQVTDIAYLESFSAPQKLIAVVDGSARNYFENGRYRIYQDDSCYDLFMAPVKKEVWISLYTLLGPNGNRPIPYISNYDSEQAAKDGFPECLGTFFKAVKVHEYEE